MLKDGDSVRIMNHRMLAMNEILPRDHVYTVAIIDIPGGYAYKLDANDTNGSFIYLESDELEHLEAVEAVIKTKDEK